MAKPKGAEKTRPALYKVGDRVTFVFGSGQASGEIVEDRGCLGVGGRRLYGIRFAFDSGDQRYIEVPEEELTAEAAEQSLP
jgi:hypothetical protein